MANMSYCRFENTSNDLRDCVSVMEEAYDLPDLDLSASETRSMEHMRELCEDFLRQYERLQAASTEDFDAN